MKSFVTSLGASLALALAVLAPAVSADSSRYWQLDMYQPTAGTTAHTINVEWKALSTVETDHFTVDLFENGFKVAEQGPTSKPFGDSGAFNLTVADGTYSFRVAGTNDGDGSTQTTEDKTVTVTTASGGTKVVFVNNGSTTGSTATTSGQALGSSTASGGTTTGTGSNTSGTTGNTSTGNVNAPGGSNTKNNGKVLGVETTNNHTTRNTWIAGIAAALALLLALYYWLARRANSNR